MTEDAFYDRLREGFNDIFLTAGLDGATENRGAGLRPLQHDPPVVPEVQPEPHRRREGPQAGRLPTGPRLPPGAPRRADAADRTRRPHRPAVHRRRDRRLRHGDAVHGPRVRRVRSREGPVQEPGRPVRVGAGDAQGAGQPGPPQRPVFGHRGVPARWAARHVPVPPPLPDDRDEPQPPPRPHVLPALPRRGRAGTRRPDDRRCGGHGQVPGADDAGRRVRRLPPDARPRGRAVPGLLEVRGRVRPPQRRLVPGHVRRRL